MRRCIILAISLVLSPLLAKASFVPTEFGLYGNMPNPFNSMTEIAYALSEDVPVRLVVYTLLGQTVAILVDEPQSAGYHTVTWDAWGVPSGVYFGRLEAGSFVETKGMLLLK